MRSHHRAGFTWVELLVSIVVIAVVVALVLSATIHAIVGSCGQSQEFSNMKQLQLATQQMALDGAKTGQTNLGWPGDTGGTFTNWARQLVPDYLTTNALCQLLSLRGHVLPRDTMPTANTNAILVYAVNTNSPDDAIFLSTANISNTAQGPKLDPTSRSYQSKQLWIMHRDGSGVLLNSNQITNIAKVGTWVPLCK